MPPPPLAAAAAAAAFLASKCAASSLRRSGGSGNPLPWWPLSRSWPYSEGHGSVGSSTTRQNSASTSSTEGSSGSEASRAASSGGGAAEVGADEAPLLPALPTPLPIPAAYVPPAAAAHAAGLPPTPAYAVLSDSFVGPRGLGDSKWRALAQSAYAWNERKVWVRSTTRKANSPASKPSAACSSSDSADLSAG